jgi:photosystem II stability/assembly factor-like uncharacterized protein
MTLYAIGFNNDKNHSVIAKSNDLGKTWECTFFNDFLFSICFPTDSVGYMFSKYGNAYKTINAGNSWKVIHLSLDTSFSSIGFFDNLNGILTGTNILTTQDGGVTWTTPLIFNGLGSYFSSISIVSNKIGYLIFDTSLYKTINSGLSWDLVQHTAPHIMSEAIWSIYFPNDSIGYLVLSQHIYKTINGGLSWGLQSSPIGDFFIGMLNDIFFLNADTGFLVGEFGQFYKTFNGGGSFVNVKNLQKKFVVHLYPNPVSKYLNIEMDNSGKAFFKFINFQGQLIYETEIENNNTIDLSNYDDGLYLVSIVTDYTIYSEIILLKK